MNTLVIPAQQPESGTPTLEERLRALQLYGDVRVGWLNAGWFASLEFHSPSTGMKMDLRSDWNHSSPSSAVTQLENRLTEARAILNPQRSES